MSLIDQLDTENVLYRKELRETLKKFNHTHIASEIIIKKYQYALENDGEEILNWLKIY
jgi:hypothetical protein